MSEQPEPLIPRDDPTATLEEQAKSQGWKADIFSFNKAEQPGVEFFNPGLVRRPDGLWLLVRRSEQVPNLPYGMNRIWACRLVGDNEKVAHGGPLLVFPNSNDEEQFEDARAVYFNGQTWVAACNFTWFPGDGSWWTGAHQCLGVFRDDDQWSAVARRDPIVGTNKGSAGHTHGRHNKNFVWFFADGKLHLIYTSDPWLVVEFGAKWEDQIHHIGEGVKWKYGIVRGGTPPVLIDGLFYTFFHSSLHWRGRYRRYFMGALAFESTSPFKPVLWTQEPLLTGSQNNKWAQGKPLVVFPCGAIMEKGMWTVTYGSNDMQCGWIEIPHVDLVNLLRPIPVMQASLLLSDVTAAPVYEKIPFEEQNGGDAQCNVTADSQSQESTTTGAIPSNQFTPQSGNAGPTFEPSVPAVKSFVGRFNPVTGEHFPSVADGAQLIKKPRGRPRKDGLPPGSVPKPKRRRRRKKKKSKREE